ncbi:hypothetical protein ABPG72_021043 [Tetrahymena utriculariae]
MSGISRIFDQFPIKIYYYYFSMYISFGVRIIHFLDQYIKNKKQFNSTQNQCFFIFLLQILIYQQSEEDQGEGGEEIIDIIEVKVASKYDRHQQQKAGDLGK